MDLTKYIQQFEVGKFHYRLLIMIGLGWLFDAMDTGLISFIMARLVDAWALTANQKASIVSITFVGMAIGAILAGSLADKFGRKKVFIGTLVIYSLATAGCGLSNQLTTLLIFRLIVGIGLGGQLPVAVSLMSEYLPSNVRGRFIVLLESFWGLGWLVAAILAYFVIPNFGWQTAFLLGGLPIFYAFFLYYHLPESIPFLLQKGQKQQALDYANQICLINKQPPLHIDLTQITLPTHQKTKFSFARLWEKNLYKSTLMLWILWFGIVFSYYGIFTWLPSLLIKQGFTIVSSFEYTLAMILAQLPGYLFASWCVEKFGRKITLAGLMIFCALCSYFFGQAGSTAEILFWGCLMSFSNLGAWGVVYTYTPELYPIAMRAFGSGWASAIGRVGGMVAPLVIAHMMNIENAFNLIFMMFTMVMVIIAMAVLTLGEETKGRIIT